MRILAAMSGGVDSSVAAAQLLREGHDVVGAYMKNWINEEKIIGDCPWQQDIEDARAVAGHLGIEFRVVNLMDEYRERVVKYLLEGYQAGITPNPDVMCNREMKFGVFLDYAREEGFEAVATGHYVRRRDNDNGSADILCGVDGGKNQAYFLALLRQEQLKGALFPVGDLLKPELRELARELGLPNAEKKDSQGICFIGQVKMSDFLRTFVPDNPGLIVDLSGNVLGEHQGLHLYTLGQRRGIGVPSNAYREAYVVIAKKADENELVVAFESEDTPFLYASSATVGDISFVNCHPDGELILAQPRYRTPAVEAELTVDGKGDGKVLFRKPQRALTPGQICAFYNGEVLLGGAVFREIHHH
ncbi:MAG: tRNA 2-thiouridine(34) synthase MnmA [Verrucomicrobiaceae bacterium]|nr:tRNA 2-thiouridine(34) synthase MnmA [Verrucomicrobiaceae bacterium]